MRISAKIDYACRAILELALHWPNNEPVQINEIAKNQNIPMKFLTHILINLKQLGYTQSIRGKKGGYTLAKAPIEIPLSALVNDLGSVGYSIAENRNNVQNDHIMDSIWNEIDAVVLKAMNNITFETICNRKRRLDNVMMFNI